MTLWTLKPNQQAIITGLDPSLPATHQQRLKHLGFSEGNSVSCVKSIPFSGPSLYLINNSVYSVEQGIASLISIREF